MIIGGGEQCHDRTGRHGGTNSIPLELCKCLLVRGSEPKEQQRYGSSQARVKGKTVRAVKAVKTVKKAVKGRRKR